MRSVPADPAAITEAARHIRAGAIIGMPTETVYGLAGDATNPAAVARIFAAKGRPRFNPLIAHVLDAAMAQAEAILDARADQLINAFWPGPLTVVAPRRSGGRVCDLACAGLASIALRAPAHPVARALIAEVGAPLAAPSANPSGKISPTRAEHIVADGLADVAMVLDGGACAHGVESTIIALIPGEPARLLRQGAIPIEHLIALLGPIALQSDGAITAPGQLDSHYAPRALLRLNALNGHDDEILIGFGDVASPHGLSLSHSGDLNQAAERLYALLREADALGTTRIAVAPVPDTGLGAAINDRLRRAAAARDG